MTKPVEPRPARTGRRRLSPLVLALVLLLVAAVALALWWWSLRSMSDPIDANPVSTTATVVASPPCGEGGKTTVQLTGVHPGTDSTLDGCGFTVGERLAVDYLAGSPESARLTGTTRAGESPMISKILPIVILVAGFACVAMLGFAAAERRSRRPAAGSRGPDGASRSRRRRGGGPAVTVDDLRARIAAARAENAGTEVLDPDAARPKIADSEAVGLEFEPPPGPEPPRDMTAAPSGSVRAELSSALVSAMKRRDKAAAATYRTAIAAIDNAGAIPLGEGNRAGAIEDSPVGVGAAEAARRDLTDADMVRIVRAEIDEARAAADLLEGRDEDGATRLRTDARLLDELLASHAAKES